MDPNENLREQREIVARLLTAWGSEDNLETKGRTVGDVIDDGQRLAELVLALDSWLLKGGVFPKAWAGRGA